jgi:hypothetical protein
MARSFSTDGAFDAGVASPTAPPPGTPTDAGGSSGGSPSANPVGQNTISDAQAAQIYGSGALSNGALNGFGGQFQGPPPITDPSLDGSDPSNSVGVFFADGGDVGDDNPSQQPPQGADPMGTLLQKALGTTDTVLQQLYAQYGLGGQSQSPGGIQDQAANMPAVPASQSESGVKPLQPMPGPLPPTSNPFGQRQAANMPTVPGTQSNSGVPPVQPMPGPLPPTSNPFGQRQAQAGGIDTGDDQENS